MTQSEILSAPSGSPLGSGGPVVRHLHAMLPRILGDRKGGAGLAAIRGALSLASIPYGIAVRARAAAYGRGLIRSTRLPRPVLSVGNITVGGTGKTPVVETLARRLGDRHRVVILMRGYASTAQGSDEANQLRANLPGVRVYTGANRVRRARQALREGEVDIFLLDDGFQHLRVRRDLDIVTVDALRPFGFGRVLPRGLLREPISAIRRAQVVAITRVNQASAEEVRRIRGRIGGIHPGALVVEFEIRSDLVRDGAPGGEAPGTSPLRGEAVLPFCGIGNPDSFAASLREMGSEVDLIVFPDHHDYRRRDIRFLEEEGRRRGATAWVTTQKDAEKVRRLAPPFPLWWIRVRARPAGGWEDLQGRIEEAIRPKG